MGRLRLLERLPDWATTGVGSLPFDRAADAVTHVFASYDVPFCPQLPALDGDMITEWLGADPRRCGWSPERDRARPRAWDAFRARVAFAPPASRVVKLQVTGPATLAGALGDPGLAGELSAWLAANVAEQVRALEGVDVLLVVDEPALHLVGAVSERVWDPLRAVAPAWGLHTCGPVPWALVDRAEPDVLSFDLSLGAPDESVLRRLVARGGRVAWGVIQPHRRDGVAEAQERLRAVFAVGASSLLTASCGTGRMSARREVEIAGALETLQTRRGFFASAS